MTVEPTRGPSPAHPGRRRAAGLSAPAGMLPGMPMFLAAAAGAAAVWAVAAAGVGALVGRSIRLAEQRRPRLAPELDASLFHDDDDPEPDPEPEPGLPGAILALAYAPDETTARYWLAVCARRGAPWELQRDLWDTWQRERAGDVTRVRTDRGDTRP